MFWFIALQPGHTPLSLLPNTRPPIPCSKTAGLVTSCWWRVQPLVVLSLLYLLLFTSLILYIREIHSFHLHIL